ncbi:hypothetical protein AA313_de0210010 [Arthrobotrys entomopaga]|nr:hypothetical protein AA313_de0210010 [Arthrobotrys entomopaga]
MPIATLTRTDPNRCPTTVGMVAKNDPFATPLMSTNAINVPMLVLTGHKISILRALASIPRNKAFTAPSRSARAPKPIRPSADAKLNPATRPAPADELSPMLRE